MRPAPAVTGQVAIPQILSTYEIAQINQFCLQIKRLPEEERRVGDKPHAGTHHLVEIDERIPLVDEVLDRAPLLVAVSELIGPSFERLQVSYRSPQPGYGAQKLHADGLPKLDDGPDILATAIVALVDFTATNGSTRVVPGSHRRPDLQRMAGRLENHPDEVRLVGPAGTAFVFSGHLLHSGTRNDSPAERPALQLQWQRV